jgi:ABC-type transport system involved in cytochrome c biogenesis permease subunit
MKKLLPYLFLSVVVLLVLASLRAPGNAGPHDIVAFGRLPTLVNGRIKPLDTVARTSLLTMQGRQRVTSPDGRRVAPAEWLLDVLYRPEIAHRYQTFEIVHPDILAMLNLTPEAGAGKKRFSFLQLMNGLTELDRQAKLADNVESAVRTPFQSAVVQLRHNVVLYQRLQSSLVASGSGDFLEQLAQFEAALPDQLAARKAQRAGQPYDAALARAIADLGTSAATMEAFGYLLPIPPETDKADPLRWRSAGASLRESLDTGRLNPALSAFARIGLAWRSDQPALFNTEVEVYRAQLDREVPGLTARCDIEARFNSAQPFMTSLMIYVVAFLCAVVSWLKWPDVLGRSAFWLVAVAWILATLGIGVRMWLEGRPPVTNLYSSALFVGWAAVALCLVIETMYKNAIGSAAGGMIGFATLIIAHHLSLGGDTLEMMRAVLDSNFWLATHVITVTIGYSATYLAGFLALIYVGRGLFTRSLDPQTAEGLVRMVYGIVCFATLFSFVGTVLGGIWADQSWGRFWGWDPKENGALIIVLWNALILHARWGGLVKARGLMVLAIFGNIVTSWSWFGVNMLGVGLHSYGFMDAGFWWLMLFAVSQLGVMMLAGLPLDRWRSFQSRSK